MLVLLVGVLTGTYSSIFNASALLVAWENGDFGRLAQKFVGRGPRPRLKEFTQHI